MSNDTDDITKKPDCPTAVRPTSMYNFLFTFGTRLISVFAKNFSISCEDIFRETNEYALHNELKWKDCVSVCTDGAERKDLQLEYETLILIYKRNCQLHREDTVDKSLPSSLKVVIGEVIKVISGFKSKLATFSFYSENRTITHNTLDKYQ